MVILQLLVNQNWIHRRVEKAVYTDPVTIRRTKSLDFTLPVDHESPMGCIGGERLDYVPIAMMTKWRIANVDIRDEHGGALPLVDRKQHTPIVTAMLIAVAHLARHLPIPTSADDSQLPAEIEHELWKLVGSREEWALNICEELSIKKRVRAVRSMSGAGR